MQSTNQIKQMLIRKTETVSSARNEITTFGPSKVSELILGGINIVPTQLRGRGVAKMCENACSENALK